MPRGTKAEEFGPSGDSVDALRKPEVDQTITFKTKLNFSTVIEFTKATFHTVLQVTGHVIFN